MDKELMLNGKPTTKEHIEKLQEQAKADPSILLKESTPGNYEMILHG